MHWIQIILETSRQVSAPLEDRLLELGALAVTYVDAADQPLFEPGPGETPLWDAVRLIAPKSLRTKTGFANGWINSIP